MGASSVLSCRTAEVQLRARITSPLSGPIPTYSHKSSLTLLRGAFPSLLLPRPAQNLCFRMADWRNLSVLLPEPPQLALPPAERALAGKLGRLGWPAPFLGPRPAFVPNTADVITSHAVWSRLMAPMTRGGRPFTFTILREPVAQVESCSNLFAPISLRSRSDLASISLRSRGASL